MSLPDMGELAEAVELLEDDKYRPHEITKARLVVFRAARAVLNAPEICARCKRDPGGDIHDADNYNIVGAHEFVSARLLVGDG